MGEGTYSNPRLSWSAHLNDVLETKEYCFGELSSSTLKVGVDILDPRRVLKVMGHLQTE